MIKVLFHYYKLFMLYSFIKMGREEFYRLCDNLRLRVNCTLVLETWPVTFSLLALLFCGRGGRRVLDFSAFLRDHRLCQHHSRLACKLNFPLLRQLECPCLFQSAFVLPFFVMRRFFSSGIHVENLVGSWKYNSRKV